MQTKDPALTKTPINETHTDKASSDQKVSSDKVSVEQRANHDEIEDNTTVNKGTDTFEEDIVETKHVKEDDNPARQPDRRDQKGNPFDGNINEHNKKDDEQKSEEITDMNRYANVDNAQTRILNPDEKDQD